MSTKYPLHRRVERPWSERFKALGDRIAAAAERALQRVFSPKGALIPVPVRVVARRRPVRSPID
jgi:hypothetical protein